MFFYATPGTAPGIGYPMRASIIFFGFLNAVWAMVSESLYAYSLKAASVGIHGAILLVNRSLMGTVQSNSYIIKWFKILLRVVALTSKTL